MNLSTKELDALLKANPEISVVPDRIDAPKGHPNLTLSGYAAQHGGYVPAGELASGAGGKVPKMSEWEMQKAVIDECDRRAIAQPEWGLVAAIPNGQVRPGQRIEPGLRSGLPDLVIFAARHSRHACFIELKIKPNDLTESQRFWQRRLRVEGYICEVVWDRPEEVLSLIDWYLFR